MEKYQCLVCGREMVVHHLIKYVDHTCVQTDHHFSWRIKNHQLLKLRIRFSSSHERLYLKVHYDEKFSEVWATDNESQRIKINQIIIPDFEDIEKLKQKIRTYLLFS